MKIPQSSLKSFGYTGIPTITDSDVVFNRIEDALSMTWIDIWVKEECRGASLRRITACLKSIAVKFGGKRPHCQIDEDFCAKKSIIVWYELPCGGYKGTRLIFP